MLDVTTIDPEGRYAIATPHKPNKPFVTLSGVALIKYLQNYPEVVNYPIRRLR